MKHEIAIGAKVKIVDNRFLDHLEWGLIGTVVSYTLCFSGPDHPATATYEVLFENGAREEYCYPDEIEPVE